jgi:hypothetical protein
MSYNHYTERLNKLYSAVTYRSPMTITIIATNGSTSIVHKNILIYFLEYYKAALTSHFT